MMEQLLFNTLLDEFRTVGTIKYNKQKKKPLIDLIRNEKNKTQLSGCAEITFENEGAVVEAVKKYNQMRVPTLNNAQIGVMRSEKKSSAFPNPLPPSPSEHL
ncbi:unnamed protein product [Adineta steineri]|uniref:RRM domain-containing protein n=1 Tax=Adineta steineri TaxID=433720 RepID=A0A816G136_9BILA|nr:unnamed protein product [Adineta steineri]CAF1667943.1 unnamed protein product [Adineta steineri]